MAGEEDDDAFHAELVGEYRGEDGQVFNLQYTYQKGSEPADQYQLVDGYYEYYTTRDGVQAAIQMETSHTGKSMFWVTVYAGEIDFSMTGTQVELEELQSDSDEPIHMSAGKYQDGDIVKVLCIVTKKKTRLLKQRGYMAFVTLEDTSGSMEMMVFPQTYEQYRYLLEENQVLYVEARLSIREDEETKLVCRMAAPPQQLLEPKTKEGSQQPTEQLPQERKPTPSAAKQEVVRRKKGRRPGLYLRVPSQQSREFTKSQQYLEIFEGELPVYFFFLDTQKLVCAPQRLWITFNKPLYCQLERILGTENVVLVEPER